MHKLTTPLLIARKRDGQELSDDQIVQFITGVVDKSITNEQIGAMLMAIFLKGMTVQETITLTTSMRDSGAKLSWPEWKGLVVDKHSTGGVGDKISIPLAPALATFGLKVPMISGRGLGHTGGTLDKLESIPGYKVEQSTESMHTILDKVGCCIVGQSAALVPGDRILYSVRDVTATVESIPLITASIISKKAAEGLDSLLLDVKVGRAAFMKTEAQARELAQSMANVGNGAGIKTVALLTAMDHPIGRLIGNALEIAESVFCLQGKGPADLEELVCTEGAHLLAANGNVKTPEEGYEKIKASLHDGTALAKFQQMVAAQGATEETAVALCKDPWSVLPVAQHKTSVTCEAGGFIGDIDALKIALIAGRHGAGRMKLGDVLDYAVGIELNVSVGQSVTTGSVLAVFHHTRDLAGSEIKDIRDSFVIQQDPPVVKGLVIGSV